MSRLNAIIILYGMTQCELSRTNFNKEGKVEGIWQPLTFARGEATRNVASAPTSSPGAKLRRRKRRWVIPRRVGGVAVRSLYNYTNWWLFPTVRGVEGVSSGRAGVGEMLLAAPAHHCGILPRHTFSWAAVWYEAVCPLFLQGVSLRGMCRAHAETVRGWGWCGVRV